MRKTGWLSAGLVALLGMLATTGLGQAPVITSFQGNGVVTWTNNLQDANYRIEWTPSLGSPWRRTWQDLSYIEAHSNSVVITSVPMFYRVAMITNPPPGMAFVDAGVFKMGDIYGEAGGDPVRTVYVSAFYIDKYKVSNEQMRQVLQWAYDHGKISADTNTVVNLEGDSKQLLNLAELAAWFPSNRVCQIAFSNGIFSVTDGKESFPCVNVSWYGALAYCNYKSDMSGLPRCVDFTNWSCAFSNNGYRLPTEAEWEKAARGGLVGHHFPWPSYGGSWSNWFDSSKANWRYAGHSFTNAFPHTTPVGYYNGSQTPSGVDMANGYGLYDMAGNAYEWCWDWAAAYSMSDTNDPTGTTTPQAWRVMRAGSWHTDNPQIPAWVTCGGRSGNVPSDTIGQGRVGFRTARR